MRKPLALHRRLLQVCTIGLQLYIAVTLEVINIYRIMFMAILDCRITIDARSLHVAIFK